MPRSDDFLKAIALAREELSTLDPLAVCQKADAQLISLSGEILFSLSYFVSPLKIAFPTGRMEYESSSDKLSLQEQGLILHYLLSAEDIPLTKELITFREIPSGEFYYQAFLNRAQVPLVSTFGSAHDLFRQAGKKLGGTEGGIGDVSLTFLPFPRVPITMALWSGDEEFPPGGNIVFDSSIKRFLSGEDIAFLAGTVVYKLVALSRC